MTHKSCLIYADNIQSSGGVVLLQSLLNEFKNQKLKIYVNPDFKFSQLLSKNWKIIRVRNNFFARLKTNIDTTYDYSQVKLYFGNIPPLLKTKNSYLFIQNILLLKLKNIKYIRGLMPKTKFFLNFVLLRLFGNNCEKIVLQNNESVYQAQMIWGNDKIFQFPFMPYIKNYPKKHIKYDFLFVGGFDPHKNLINVLRSWEKNKKLGMPGSLAITVTKKEFKRNFISKNDLDLNIIFLGNMPHSKCVLAISESRCLIFSSSLESLALPLIEAKICGTEIIASEQDFVYEVCKPYATFVETNINSISRALFKFIKMKNSFKKLKLKTVRDFKNFILN